MSTLVLCCNPNNHGPLWGVACLSSALAVFRLIHNTPLCPSSQSYESPTLSGWRTRKPWEAMWRSSSALSLPQWRPTSLLCPGRKTQCQSTLKVSHGILLYYSNFCIMPKWTYMVVWTLASVFSYWWRSCLSLCWVVLVRFSLRSHQLLWEIMLLECLKDWFDLMVILFRIYTFLPQWI